MEPAVSRDGILLGDLFRPVVAARRVLVFGAIAAGAVAFVICALYNLLGPRTLVAQFAFTPTFVLDADVRYPDRLPFAPEDVIAPHIVDAVTGRDARVACARDSRTRFSVRTISRPVATGETAATHEAPTHVVQLEVPLKCQDADFVAQQVPGRMADEWSRASLQRILGLLNDETIAIGDNDQPLIGQAERLRLAADHVDRTMRIWQRVPGVKDVKTQSGATVTTLLTGSGDLHERLLPQFLDSAGAGIGEDSIQWLTRRLALESDRLFEAESRREAFRITLTAYVGSLEQQATGGAKITGTHDNPQEAALTAQHRRALAEQLRIASLAVTDQEVVVRHYRTLLAATASSRPQRPAAAVHRDFGEVVRTYNAIAQQVRELRGALNEKVRDGSLSLYRAEGAPVTHIENPISLRTVALIVVGASLFGLWLLAVSAVAWPALFTRRR